jgi:hypothetical protein
VTFNANNRSFASTHLLHHHRLFTEILDLLNHIELFLYVAVVRLKHNWVWVQCEISFLMGASWNICYISKFRPVLALINLGSAGIDTLDNFDLFSLKDVTLVVSLDYIFETGNNFTIN